MFRLHDGRRLEGELRWSEGAGAGTTARRDRPLALAGAYPLIWRHYSEVAAPRYGRFQYLAVQIEARS